MSKTTTETVTLLKPHTHIGVKHAVGAKIPVLPHEKQWLIEREIIAGEPKAKAEKE